MGTEAKDQRSMVMITGMSGSGKRTAFKAFEDLGYFCVDNLPTALVPRLVEMTLAAGGKIDRLAVTVDARLGESVEEFKELFRRAKELPFNVRVLFLDATDRILAQRYSETRRVHPLARDASLLEGFRREREAMADIRDMADLVIDTTELSSPELRDLIRQEFGQGRAASGPVLTLISFGFKRGLPFNADLVFDVRFLANPHNDPLLRPMTGADPEVAAFLDSVPEAGEILQRIEEMLEYLLPRYVREGKSYCTVGIGCTGGRHRSVYSVRRLAERLSSRGVEVKIIHRDMHLG